MKHGNYQLLKHEILDALIAGRSTSALSRKLGFSFDQVRRWKNGTKHLRWDEFCDLCEAVKAPLAETCRDLFGISVTKKRDLYRIVGPLKVFSQIGSTAVLAKQQGVSLSVMKRYLAGTTSPDVEFVLELIDCRRGFLAQFAESLKRPASKSKATIFSFPWFPAVSSAMALNENLQMPVHSSLKISKFLGLSEKQVEDVIQLMVSLNLIEKKGEHYAPTLARTFAVGSRINEWEFGNAMRYWTKRALERYSAETGAVAKNEDPLRAELDRGFFRTFATDVESAQKVTGILSRAEQEIHEVLTASKAERTELRVMVMHHFPANVVAWSDTK